MSSFHESLTASAMAKIAGAYTERVHGWFRLLTETLGRRKHFAVSFLNASQDTTRSKMEEVLIMDDPRPANATTTNNHNREPNGTNVNEHPVLAHNDKEIVENSTHKPKGQTPYTITVCISKGCQGYGFSVKWTKPPRVERVEPGLPADVAGLRTGDYIIFVGEHNVVKYDEEAVLQIIRESGETIIMEVYRRGVSKVPKGLVNGFANRASVSESTNSNESHPRKRLSHISFNTEATEQDRQNIIYALVNCEQSFSHACRFGLERYLIPLKFRTDLMTPAQHAALFNNMDQLVDMSESIVDRMMGTDENDSIGDKVGFMYYQVVDELAEHYSKYFNGLPEADKVLSQKLHELDFKDFLLTPQIPRRKPDITTFIHKPAEHLRELVGILTQLYSSAPGHNDNTYLDNVLEELKACYRGMTSQQNIMEPTPSLPPSSMAGNALRPPLVSVSDIEQRLVFTKYTQPFRLHDNRRQWVFGGELFKFEGRNLKQYWVMLFTDLLLFTKINRDRVIFVMEDPVPLSAVVHALFTVKKKATEFRLIIDSSVKVPGSSNSYMTLPKTQNPKRKKKIHNTVTLGRENKRTLVLRAPTIELKATWNNLIQRQLYACQQLPSPPPLYGDSAPSLVRAVSTSGLHSPPVSAVPGRFSRSVGDLRPNGDSEEFVLDVNDAKPKPSQKLVFKSSKVIHGRTGKENVEELELDFEDDNREPGSLPVQPRRPAEPSYVELPIANHRQPSVEPNDDVELKIQDVGSLRGYSRVQSPRNYSRSNKSKKTKQRATRTRKGGRRSGGRLSSTGGGEGRSEEIVLNLNEEVHQPSSNGQTNVNRALYSRSQSEESVPGIVVSQNSEDAEQDNLNEDQFDDDDCNEDFVIEDVKTGAQTRLAAKKGIGSRVKDRLFPNRHLPKKKQIDRTKKVEKFVDSLMIEDLNHPGRVTPVFDREEQLTHQDFTQKRQTLLRNHPKNFIEGDTEVIIFDDAPPAESSVTHQSAIQTKQTFPRNHPKNFTDGENEIMFDDPPPESSLSPMRAEQMMAEEKRQMALRKKEEKKMELKLEGIEEESPDHYSSLQKPVVSPEAYEDYIGESVEDDYPELAGGSDMQREQYYDSDDFFAQKEQELYEQEQQRLLREQEEYELRQQQKLQQQMEDELLLEQQRLMEEEELRMQQELEQEQLQLQLQQQQQQQELEQKPTGPLSGSASMSFMDEHSPTSSGNSDFYHQCISKSSRDLPKPALVSCSVESKFSDRSFSCKSYSNSNFKSNLVKNSKVHVDEHLRTSATKDGYAGADRNPKRTISLSSSASASVNGSRNNSTSTSEQSSMSISTCSVSSNALSVKKNRYCLFLPTSTTSLPEISIEPPTPQAPKPKDNFDRENKIKYDLRVPGYRSMFLTVPGFDDDDSDRYLPKYSYDSNEEESSSSSSSDDDVIHKPRAFASLAGMGDNQRLRRYGSSCDIAQFGVYGEDTSYSHSNDYNANMDLANCKSKVGGTGSGSFVADKLAVFEKVVEEEHKKFIECQEVRKRIFRPPKKSTENIEKFYNPQHIENIDARATVRSRSLRYYDDVFDSHDNLRNPPLVKAVSPPRSSSFSPSGYKSPEPVKAYAHQPQPRRSVLSSSSEPPIESPRTPSPLPTQEEDIYGYLGGSGPSSISPGPSYHTTTTRQCSPEPQRQPQPQLPPLPQPSAETGKPSAPNNLSRNIRCDSLDKQTNEVMEMLDNSYLDMTDLDAPSGKIAEQNNKTSNDYQAPNRNAPTSSPIAVPDPLDDVFDIEEDDSIRGSTTSVGRGGHKRKAAPAPPPPNSTSAPTENKLGAFFNRVRGDKDKDKERDKARMNKTKKEKQKKENTKDKPAGMRFQLFGGAKKTNEPSSAEGAEETSPSKDGKGKRRLFGRGKENVSSRSPNNSHKAEPQVSRISADSFDQDSIDLDDEFL